MHGHRHRQLVTGRGSAVIDVCGEKRALVKAGDVIGDEASGAEAMIKDFHLDLAAVGVAGERKLDAKFRGAIETIRIVRKKNIDHVAADERLDAGESLLALAAGSALALVVHADEIELRAVESQLRVFVAQELHAGLGVEVSGLVFYTR